MDLRGVTRFLAVAESGSLNKAAQRLNLSQPALAKSIQMLEYSLGVPLLDRTPRGVTLTSFGKSAYDHARRISSEVRRLEREIETIRTLAYGQISIGVPLGQTSGNLAFAVLQLLNGSRRVKMNIVTGTRGGLIRLLLLGDVDFLFTTLMQPNEVSLGIIQRKLYLDLTTLVVRAGHPLLKRKKLTMPELTQYPWIALSGFRDIEGALDKLLGSEFSQSLLRSGSPIFVKNILLGSDFIGLVQRDTVNVELSDKRLVEVRLSEGSRFVELFPPQKVGVIYRSDVSLSTASEALIAEMIRMTSSQSKGISDSFERSSPMPRTRAKKNRS